ncbi:hypothetical protein EMIT0P2_170086 [Pseudomonas sp. IT-P2]
MRHLAIQPSDYFKLCPTPDSSDMGYFPLPNPLWMTGTRHPVSLRQARMIRMTRKCRRCWRRGAAEVLLNQTVRNVRAVAH